MANAINMAKRLGDTYGVPERYHRYSAVIDLADLADATDSYTIQLGETTFQVTKGRDTGLTTGDVAGEFNVATHPLTDVTLTGHTFSAGDWLGIGGTDIQELMYVKEASANTLTLYRGHADSNGTQLHPDSEPIYDYPNTTGSDYVIPLRNGVTTVRDSGICEDGTQDSAIKDFFKQSFSQTHPELDIECRVNNGDLIFTWPVVSGDSTTCAHSNGNSTLVAVEWEGVMWRSFETGPAVGFFWCTLPGSGQELAGGAFDIYGCNIPFNIVSTFGPWLTQSDGTIRHISGATNPQVNVRYGSLHVAPGTEVGSASVDHYFSIVAIASDAYPSYIVGFYPADYPGVPASLQTFWGPDPTMPAPYA